MEEIIYSETVSENHLSRERNTKRVPGNTATLRLSKTGYTASTEAGYFNALSKLNTD